jgi:hypothetical protein
MEESDSVFPVKGVQHSFSTFLWREISEIRDFQGMNLFSEALKRTTSLVSYLPKEFQIKMGFKKLAEEIEEKMKEISTKSQGVDVYTSMVNNLEELDSYAEKILPGLISELCMKLDEKGYLEFRPLAPKHKGERMGVPKW